MKTSPFVSWTAHKCKHFTHGKHLDIPDVDRRLFVSRPILQLGTLIYRPAVKQVADMLTLDVFFLFSVK